MTRAKAIMVLGAAFGFALTTLGCGSTPNRTDSGVIESGGADDAGVRDAGSGDSGVPDGGADAGCTGCPLPTCSISCIPHHISRGQSTTFYWSSDGNVCSLSCPGLGLQLDVPCIGQDSSHFQNLQQTQMCTFTPTGPGGTVSCSDSVVVN